MKSYCNKHPVVAFVMTTAVILFIMVFGLSFEQPHYKVIFFLLLPMIVPLYWAQSELGRRAGVHD